jgi:hypothetical protein
MRRNMSAPPVEAELGKFCIPVREALGLARRLARADARGGSQRGVGKARRRLCDAGLTDDEAGYAALVLLAFGLRERGFDHARVATRLRAHTDPATASAAALESARIVRHTRPDLEPERLDALRRRASVIIFISFALWGALGVQILKGFF